MINRKLMPLNTWAKERFSKPPSPPTLYAMAESGEIPAKKLGGRWYVDYETELNSSGNELVDKVLNS